MSNYMQVIFADSFRNGKVIRTLPAGYVASREGTQVDASGCSACCSLSPHGGRWVLHNMVISSQRCGKN